MRRARASPSGESPPTQGYSTTVSSEQAAGNPTKLPRDRLMTHVHGHPHLDAFSLDLARLTASKIDADPSLIATAHENIERHCQLYDHLPRSQTEWLEILERPWPEIRSILLEEFDEGQRRRSSSPFTGLNTEAERHEIQARHPPPGAPPDWRPPGPFSREELSRMLNDPLIPAPLTYALRNFAIRLAYHDAGWLIDATSARDAVAAVKASVPDPWPYELGDLILWIADEYRTRYGADAIGSAWIRLRPPST